MILAVAGAAGGVGRSTLAYELAAATGAVAVDADLGMGDLPGGRGPDLHDVLAGRAAPCEAIRHDGRVSRVPCGRSLTGARAADPTRLRAAIRRIADGRDLLLDAPTGGSVLAVADAAIVVTTPRRPTRAVRRTIRRAREADAGLVAVVCNRVRNGNRVPSIAAPTATVPADDRLARSLVDARPVVTSHPETPPARAIREIASRIGRATELSDGSGHSPSDRNSV